MGEENFTMLYPAWDIVPDRGILPTVRLPLDFTERVPKFYARKGRENVEDYAEQIRKILDQPPEIMLRWHEQKGLVSISLGLHGGYDLDDETGWPAFREHNLNTRTGMIAGMIATRYVSELLKS